MRYEKSSALAVFQLDTVQSTSEEYQSIRFRGMEGRESSKAISKAADT